MKRLIFIRISITYLSFFIIFPCFAAKTADLEPSLSKPVLERNLSMIKEVYGSDVARVYETVDGMPFLDPNGANGLTIQYSRNDNPCNEIFLRENPDMAEDCKKVREEITFINKYNKEVRVHIKDGDIVSIVLSTSVDNNKSVKSRDVILLHHALVVHDCVLDRYSRNHAKMYHFPSVTPYVEFDTAQNVIFRFGERDFIKFQAENFRRTESQGFRMTCKPKFYRNGTRAIPDISYEGSLPYMVTANWTYPPLNGYFTLYNGSKKVGKAPASLFYRKMRNARAFPRFKEDGLLNYLNKQYKDGTLKKRYGKGVHKFVAGLLRGPDASRVASSQQKPSSEVVRALSYKKTP